MNDENIKSDIITKEILKKAMLKTPSSDFTNRVMHELTSENKTEKYRILKKRWVISFSIILITMIIQMIIASVFFNLESDSSLLYESLNENLNNILSIFFGNELNIRDFLVLLNITISFCLLYILDLLYQDYRNIKSK